MTAASRFAEFAPRPEPERGCAEKRAEMLPGTWPLDLVYLSRQTAGDRALEVELLGLFDRQAAAAAELLAAPPPPGESDDLRGKLARKLAGSARAVGANTVAAAAENVHHCLTAGVLRPSDVAALLEAVAQVRAALRDLAS
jgi:hypothetical protein